MEVQAVERWKGENLEPPCSESVDLSRFGATMMPSTRARNDFGMMSRANRRIAFITETS
jgi:hypothetical protein